MSACKVSDFNQILISRQSFTKEPNTKLHEKNIQLEPHWYSGQTDMATVVVALSKHDNVPKNYI
jgi:hypothetical protein